MLKWNMLFVFMVSNIVQFHYNRSNREGGRQLLKYESITIGSSRFKLKFIDKDIIRTYCHDKCTTTSFQYLIFVLDVIIDS